MGIIIKRWTHGDNEHGRAYRAAITFIKARAGIEA